MPGSKPVYYCAVFTGIALIVTSLLHAVNINDTIIAIKTGDIAVSYASSAVSVWIFSATGIFLTGIWLLFLAGDLKKLSGKAWWQALIISLALIGSGIGCWLQYPKAFHLLYFSLVGLILLIPVLLYAGKFGKKN